MSKLTDRDKILLLILFDVALAFMLWQFLLAPMLAANSALLSGITAKEQAVQDLEVRRMIMQQDIRELDEKDIRLIELTKLILPTAQTEEIHNFLQAAIDRNSLKLQSISLSETDMDDTVQSTVVILALEGGYDGFMRFLKELEASGRTIEIQSVMLPILAGGSNAEDLEAGEAVAVTTVTLNFYSSAEVNPAEPDFFENARYNSNLIK